MTLAERWRLARPSGLVDAAERRRWVLVVGCSAAVGMLLLVGSRIARYRGIDHDSVIYAGRSGQVAPLVQDSGTRGGVLAGVALLAVPIVVLLVQALRVGSAARERRFGAMRVAGASHRQLRSLAALDGASAGLMGGLVAGPAYVGLSALLFSTRHYDLHLLPRPDRWDYAAWPGVVVLMVLVAGWTARFAAVDVATGPERAGKRMPRPLPRSRIGVIVPLLAVVVVLLTRLSRLDRVSRATLIVSAIILLFAAAPYLALGAARRLARSRDPMSQIAAARLKADPRGPGRVAAVVAVCGLAFSLDAGFIGSLFGIDYTTGGDRGYYLSGAGVAAAAAALALVVCGLSLVVGASEQLLDGRRATAALSAFGVGTDELSRSLSIELRSVIVPATAVGAALGAASAGVLFDGYGWWMALAGGALAVVAALGAATLAVILLQPQIRDASSPEYLRTA